MRKIYDIINSLFHFFGIHLSIHRTNQRLKGLPTFVDEVFATIYEKHKEKTMTTWSGCYATYSAAKYVAKCEIEGDIVECGVWRGGSSIIIAETLSAYGVTDKLIHMYDTYEGMTEPTDNDYLISDNSITAANLLKKSDKSASIWAIASLEDVKKNVATANYPQENINFIQGRVESTIPTEVPDKISLLRLDTDWYESTAHELKHLFPRLVIGGVIIIDDYGFHSGARKAVDEYLEQNDIKIMLTLADTKIGATIGVKQ